MKRDGSATRQLLIEAADSLFYGEGLKSVGVEAIAEKAGVTKRTLYYHFDSKDDLIAAYLEARHQPTLERYRDWLGSFEGGLAARIQAMFGRLAKAAKDPRWKGCGFARAAAELAGLPGHPAIAAASDHKHALEAWLADLLRAEKVHGPEFVARQLMVLLDGAITQILIHRNSDYAIAAGAAAALLIENAKLPKTKVPPRR